MRLVVLSISLCIGLYIQTYGSIGHAVEVDKISRQEIKLGPIKLSIPSRLVVGSNASWIGRILGLDESSRSLLLNIKAVEVADAVNGYQKKNGSYEEDIRLMVSYVTAEERERYASMSHAREAWSGTGSYQNRVVEKDIKKGLFRVYRNINSVNSWELFRENPKSAELESGLANAWVASCLKLSSNKTDKGYIVNCKSYVILDDLVVDFTIEEINIALVDSIKEYIYKMVLSWL